MDMNEVVSVPAIRWHQICHVLKFNDGHRRRDFEEYFNCTVSWKSNLEHWITEDQTMGPLMALTFANPADATLFALKWA